MRTRNKSNLQKIPLTLKLVRSSFIAGILIATASMATANPLKFPPPPDGKKSPIPPISSASLALTTPPLPPISGAGGYMVSGTHATIPPEVTTAVDMSSTDLNRIVCPSNIRDAESSVEKGIVIKISGRDAFVKFKIFKTGDGQFKYSTTPTEIFVICGDATYHLIGIPKRIPSQIIRLGSGLEKRIKANEGLYGGLPLEKKIVRAIKEVYTDEMPDSYAVTNHGNNVADMREFTVTKRRSINIEGQGLSVNEFVVRLKQGVTSFKLNEKYFLDRKFSRNPVAVSMEKQVIPAGENVRVFVVEQRPEKQADTLKIDNTGPEVEGQGEIYDQQAAAKEPEAAPAAPMPALTQAPPHGAIPPQGVVR